MGNVSWLLRVVGDPGAGEGNRTPVVSLEGFCSTIELHPRYGPPSRVEMRAQRRRPLPRANHARPKSPRMYHDPALASTTTAARADPRPRSAVSTGCGVAGLVGLVAWVAFARLHDPVMDGPYAAMANLLACGIPMVLWSVFVD